jgi:hypothetical protein
MTQDCKPENCRSASARIRDEAHELLVEALSLAMGLLAVYWCKPEGLVAGIIIFGVAYIVTDLLHPIFWALLPMLLAGLAVVIHFCTLMTAPASFTGLVFTFLLPGLAEAYWIWAKWATMGTLSHPVTLMCAVWLALLGIWIFARYRVVSTTS